MIPDPANDDTVWLILGAVWLLAWLLTIVRFVWATRLHRHPRWDCADDAHFWIRRT